MESFATNHERFSCRIRYPYRIGPPIRETTRAVVRLLPEEGRGWSGKVVAAGTHEGGTLAIRYFIQGASIEEIQKDVKKFHGTIYRALRNGASNMEMKWDDDEYDADDRGMA